MLQPPDRAAAPADPLASVRRWLFCVAGLVALWVVAGGGAGLTVSSLSSAEGQAFAALPAWPIGLAFALPLAFFWLKGLVQGGLRWRLLFILALGGLQALAGWWMPQSGLSAHAEAARGLLTAHLLLASIAFAAILWTAEGLRPNFRDPLGKDAQGFRFESALLLALAFAQIGFGALAAGVGAGSAFDGAPPMNGPFFPPIGDLFSLSPWWVNFTETPALAQVLPRMTASVALPVALFHAFHISRERLARRAVRRAVALALLVLAQAGLGMAAMTFGDPLPAALAHRALAVGVLALSVVHRRKLG
jgi:cytochrome c oxidase assembly protein subunit 15